MKKSILAVLAVVGAAALPLWAQTPLDVLTPEEKQHLEKTHDQAVKAFPGLVREEDHIHGEIEALKAGAQSPSREDVMKEFIAHRHELEADMLKTDPTIKPVIDKLHAEETRLRAAAAAPAPTSH